MDRARRVEARLQGLETVVLAFLCNHASRGQYTVEQLENMKVAIVSDLQKSLSDQIQDKSDGEYIEELTETINRVFSNVQGFLESQEQ